MSQIAFCPPPTVKVLCNLCGVDAGPFPSPMQAAAAVLDQGWFNHGVKVSICPTCLAYYRTVFQNPSLPGLAKTLQPKGENLVEMPSRNLMVLKRMVELPALTESLSVLPLLSVGDPVFLTSEKEPDLGISGQICSVFAPHLPKGSKFAGSIEICVVWVSSLGPELEAFAVLASGVLRSTHGMCYLLTAVPGSVLERLQTI